MTSLFKCSRIFNNLKIFFPVKHFSISSNLYLKEIHETKINDSLILEGLQVSSPRQSFMLKKSVNACPICSTGLDVKHTDVLILSQFVRSDGCMLPRRITGLCRTQQKRMSSLVTMAQKAGLMANLNPKNSKKDPTARYQWKKFNKYFDESTIKFKSYF